MWVTPFAPLGKPSRFSSIIGNWKCSLRRLSTKPTRADAKNGGKRWTAEENRKLAELFRRGFKMPRIMSEMQDRSYMSIQTRLREIKTGHTSQETGTGEKRRAWSAEENALLLLLQQQGLKLGEISSNFPDRSYSSVKESLYRLHLWPDAPKSSLKNFPREHTQRIIDMRLKEAKSLVEIASEFKCNSKLIGYVWAQRCVKMLSKEEQDSVHGHRHWTPHEWKRLSELHHQGTLCVQDVALQFPSKTFKAVSVKASRQQLRFPFHSKEPEALVTKR